MTWQTTVAAAFTILFGAHARAQVDSFAPRFTQRDLDRCIESLEFQDESEAEPLQAVYEDFLGRHHREADLAREAVERVGEARAEYLARNPHVFSPWTEEGKDFGLKDAIFAWQAKLRELEQQLQLNVLATLKPSQQETWLRLVRAFRRERLLPEVRDQGRIRSSSDLIALLDSFDLTDDEAQLTLELADEYATTLDVALRHWDDEAYVLRAQINTVAKRPATNSQELRDRILGLQEKIAELASTINDINVSYASQIASNLSDENRHRFLEQLGRIEYPQFFLSSPIDLAVQYLRDLDRLTEEQRQDLEAIYASYVVQRAHIRQRIIQSIHRWNHARATEKARRRELYEQLQEEDIDPNMALQDHPINKWLEKRRALARTTSESIRRMFPREDFESLPLSIQIALSF